VFTTESGTATKIEKTQNTLKSGTAKLMFGRTTVKSGTAFVVLAVLVAPRQIIRLTDLTNTPSYLYRPAYNDQCIS